MLGDGNTSLFKHVCSLSACSAPPAPPWRYPGSDSCFAQMVREMRDFTMHQLGTPSYKRQKIQLNLAKA